MFYLVKEVNLKDHDKVIKKCKTEKEANTFIEKGRKHGKLYYLSTVHPDDDIRRLNQKLVA